MTPANGTLDLVAFVARSSCRAGILEALCGTDALARRDLRDRFDISRTTVGRNLAALEDRGLIERTNGGYAASRTGQLVGDAFGDLVESVGVATELESVAEWLPDAFDLPLELLADAEVTLAEPANPYAPVNRHEAALAAIDEGRALLPITGLNPLRALAERVVDTDATFEAVVEPDVAATFRDNGDYADHYEALVETGRFSLFVHEGSVPCYVGLLDGTVQLGLKDDGGMPRALLETDAERVRDWGADCYARYRANTERVA